MNVANCKISRTILGTVCFQRSENLHNSRFGKSGIPQVLIIGPDLALQRFIYSSKAEVLVDAVNVDIACSVGTVSAACV